MRGSHAAIPKLAPKIHTVLRGSHAAIPKFASKLPLKRSYSNVTKLCHNAVLQTQNLAQILNFSPLLLLHTPNSQLPFILPCHFQMFYLATSLPLPEGRVGTP
jgi:hypothetical protein